ncbi:MAG TPA: flagellar protein FliT, partial [Candidatus Omnitrophota bacterium]|nr:flagellar protein FliT [Candidatus Omnitrophota bacterium]
YGYYLPATKEEIKDYLDTFRNELLDMLQTFNRQKRAKKAYLESLQMEDLFNFEPDPAGQLMFK